MINAKEDLELRFVFDSGMLLKEPLNLTHADLFTLGVYWMRHRFIGLRYLLPSWKLDSRTSFTWNDTLMLL